jgi:GNAT superfamily N-acetyltransferase
MSRIPPPVHPLAEIIRDADAGRFPPVDGRWSRVPTWRDGVEGIVCFTGHAVLAVGSDVSHERIAELGADGFGGAAHPRLLCGLAGPDGEIGSQDALLAGHGTGGGTGGGAAAALVPRPDLNSHPRAQYAASIRDDPRPYGYQDPARSAVAILSTGLAGLTELSFELEPDHRGGGQATGLIRAALAHVPADELVVAACAPGNAASLRALLKAGFTPLGSVQLLGRPFRRDGGGLR